MTQKTYNAVESGLAGAPNARVVFVSLNGEPVASFYPPAFAGGHWRVFMETVAKAGDRLQVTDVNGDTMILAGSLEDMLGPW